MAHTWIAKQAVDNAILTVALIDHSVDGSGDLRESDASASDFVVYARSPRRARRCSRVICMRGSDEKTVEIVSVLPGKNESLPAAGRAAIPIIADRRLAVITVRQAQRPLVLKTKALAEEVFDLAQIQLM